MPMPTFSLIPNESIISHCNTSLASTVSYTDFQVPTLHTQCDNLMFTFDLSPFLKFKPWLYPEEWFEIRARLPKGSEQHSPSKLFGSQS